MFRNKWFFPKLLSIFILILSISGAVFALNAENIISKAIENVTKLDTVALEIKVEFSVEGFSQAMTMSLQSQIKEEVARLEFKAPKEFAGQIIIVDKPKDQFINYYPTGQAIRMPLSQSANSGVMNLDLSSIISLNTDNLSNLDLSRYLLSAEEAKGNDGTALYLITVVDRKKEYGTQMIWLRKSDYFPLAMENYDELGNLIMKLSLTNIEKNKVLDLKKLRTLPNGAVIFDM